MNDCLDMCTSSNMLTFMAITAHDIDSDWKMVEKLLRFEDTTDNTESLMVLLVKNFLNKFDISNWLGFLKIHNASSNDSIVTSFSDAFVEIDEEIIWGPYQSRIQFLPDVFNIAVRA